jgi:hypothetical protein
MTITSIPHRRLLIGVAGSLVALAGVATMAAHNTFAQTPTPSNGTAKGSNEDPTHEANETPEQEAAEDSGQGHFRGPGGHGSNEDAAHEANETPEHEAAEDAGTARPNKGTQPHAPKTAPSSSGSSTPAQ